MHAVMRLTMLVVAIAGNTYALSDLLHKSNPGAEPGWAHRMVVGLNIISNSLCLFCFIAIVYYEVRAQKERNVRHTHATTHRKHVAHKKHRPTPVEGT